MAKIHPKTTTTINNSDSSRGNDLSSSERETYTVWMKSLVMHSNGCTVFNSNGEIAYRVDNYQSRKSSEVFLMNSTGQVLFSINRKNLLKRSWEGYKWCNSKLDIDGEWFQVKRKDRNILGRNKNNSTCLEVIVRCNKSTAVNCYNIVGLTEGKSEFKIVDYTSSSARVLAEVMQKQSSVVGACLGDDVLNLSVEPQIDQSLIMALVIVHGMINHKL